MPHQIHLRTLGRRSSQRLGMLRNLAVAVLRYERVQTTEAKAKEVRRLIDRAIGLGRDGTLYARRRAIAVLGDHLIVEKLFTDLAARYADRASGYTRLVRLGHRVGDGAPLMLIELVEGAEPAAKEGGPRQEKAAPPKPEGRVSRARAIAQRVAGRRGERAEEPPATKPAAKKPEPKTAEPKKKAEPKKATAKKPEAKKTAPKAKSEKGASATKSAKERAPKGKERPKSAKP